MMVPAFETNLGWPTTSQLIIAFILFLEVPECPNILSVPAAVAAQCDVITPLKLL